MPVRMTQEGLARLLASIERAKRRNKDLSTRLAQTEASQRKWRAKALARGRENANLRARLKRRDKPKLSAVPRALTPRTYTPEEIATHRRIVETIRSLPPRR